MYTGFWVGKYTSQFLCPHSPKTFTFIRGQNTFGHVQKISWPKYIFWRIPWQYIWSRSVNSNMQKKMDFTLKVIGGDIAAIPGLSDAIEVWTTLIVHYWCRILCAVMHSSIVSSQNNKREIEVYRKHYLSLSEKILLQRIIWLVQQIS